MLNEKARQFQFVFLAIVAMTVKLALGFVCSNAVAHQWGKSDQTLELVTICTAHGAILLQDGEPQDAPAPDKVTPACDVCILLAAVFVGPGQKEFSWAFERPSKQIRDVPEQVVTAAGFAWDANRSRAPPRQPAV